jgi:hypothetical protein
MATIALACCIAGCGITPATPLQVTEQFWEALRADDPVTARELATAATAYRVDGMRDAGAIDEVLLGEVLRGETSAIVRTSLATGDTDGERGEIQHITFDTILVRESDSWRVDVAETQRALTGAVFANSVRQLGDALGQGVHDFGEALETGAAEISRAIREALEEIERESR